MSRVVGQLADWIRPERSWRPRVVDGQSLGFNLSGVDQALTNACRRLDVRPVSLPDHGYSRRTRGMAVRRRDGSSCWLKVGGVNSADNWHYNGEIEAFALKGLPKPQMIEHVKWVDGATSWSAILM